jgi:hypothetical protein
MKTTAKTAPDLGTSISSTMRVELKPIPLEFQRSIEQNLRISRGASTESQKISKK